MANESSPEDTGDPALDRALQILSLHQKQQKNQISTGAGVAIAGVWIAGSAMTITLMLIIFVLEPASGEPPVKTDLVGVMLVFGLIASPMIAAYSITKVILSKN
jgi:hypothetical protein